MSIRPSRLLLHRAGRLGACCRQEELAPGVFRFSFTTRITRQMGFPVSCYLVDDVLIDTGFAHVRHLALRHLAGVSLRAVACTHNHEDHLGNAGPLARAHGCPVYLHRPDLWASEGVGALKPYRHLFWGLPDPGDLQEMPGRIETARRELEVLALPGHSATQVVFLHRASGLAFSGDLYLSAGASAVMAHDDPWVSIASLRRLAQAAPRLLLTGHDGVVDDAVRRLHNKADRMQAAAERARDLHREGLSDVHIQHRLFSEGQPRDRFTRWLTQGEFCRANFVRGAWTSQAAHPTSAG